MQQKACYHLWECVHSPLPTRSGWQHSLRHPRGPGLCDVHDRREGQCLCESFFSLWLQLLPHYCLSHLLRWNRCDQSPRRSRCTRPNRWSPCRFNGTMKNEFTGFTAPFSFNVKSALCYFSFFFHQQDSEKIRRLIDAINAQTNYTIAVSIINQPL